MVLLATIFISYTNRDDGGGVLSNYRELATAQTYSAQWGELVPLKSVSWTDWMGTQFESWNNPMPLQESEHYWADAETGCNENAVKGLTKIEGDGRELVNCLNRRALVDYDYYQTLEEFGCTSGFTYAGQAQLLSNVIRCLNLRAFLTPQMIDKAELHVDYYIPSLGCFKSGFVTAYALTSKRQLGCLRIELLREQGFYYIVYFLDGEGNSSLGCADKFTEGRLKDIHSNGEALLQCLHREQLQSRDSYWVFNKFECMEGFVEGPEESTQYNKQCIR